MVRAIPWGQGAVLGGRTWQQACGFGRELLVGVGAEVRAGRWRRRWGRGGCGGGWVLGKLKTVVVPQLQFLVVVVVQFLDKVDDCPLLCSFGFGPDSAENCGVPAVASFVILRCSSSSWTRLVTCPRWQVLGPRQSTDAFG